MKPRTKILVDASKNLIDQFTAHFPDIPVRLFGSTAVAARGPDHIFLWDSLSRSDVNDIDLVSIPRYRSGIRNAMRKFGYKEDSKSRVFETLHGRLLFYPDSGIYPIEIFFTPLSFHLTLRLDHHLTIEPYTISLTDLFVSKLQYENIGRNQLIDLVVLLSSHDVTPNFQGSISGKRIALAASVDWDCYRILLDNLEILSAFISTNCPTIPDIVDMIKPRIQSLQGFIIGQPKTARWHIHNLLHQLFPNLSVGKPVDNPESDRWKTYDTATRFH